MKCYCKEFLSADEVTRFMDVVVTEHRIDPSLLKVAADGRGQFVVWYWADKQLG